MTTDLAFTVFRIGFLVLLWLLVLAAVNTLRRDIFGTVVTPRGKDQQVRAGVAGVLVVGTHEAHIGAGSVVELNRVS